MSYLDNCNHSSGLNQKMKQANDSRIYLAPACDLFWAKNIMFWSYFQFGLGKVKEGNLHFAWGIPWQQSAKTQLQRQWVCVVMMTYQSIQLRFLKMLGSIMFSMMRTLYLRIAGISFIGICAHRFRTRSTPEYGIPWLIPLIGTIHLCVHGQRFSRDPSTRLPSMHCTQWSFSALCVILAGTKDK